MRRAGPTRAGRARQQGGHACMQVRASACRSHSAHILNMRAYTLIHSLSLLLTHTHTHAHTRSRSHSHSLHPPCSDFTVNALFYNLNADAVEDLTGRGLDDLRAGLLRTPLPPQETFLDGAR